jgi:hypothetical protein
MIARTIRVELPQHLRTLAKVTGEVQVEVTGAVTMRAVLDALERDYPMLGGTIREYGTGQRRPFLRFFAAEEDLSHEGMDAVLPESVAQGDEALLVIGAVAGGRV